MSDKRFAAASFVANRSGSASRPRGDCEATRYSDEQVIFHHEFTLGAEQELFAPGRYTVETASDAHDLNGHEAHIRRSTVLIVATATGTRAVQVQAGDLDAALEADARREQLNSHSENPDSGFAAKSLREMAEPENGGAQLEELGIERVPADVFVWQGYRYSNASDAIAAAKRAKA